MRNPRVLDAIRAEAVRCLNRAGVLASRALDRRLEEHVQAVNGEGDPGGRIDDKELPRFLSLALDRAGYAGVKAVEPVEVGRRKRLGEMSVAELEEFLLKRKAELAAAAKVIDGTAAVVGDTVRAA
jgi:hypothetical protein